MAESSAQKKTTGRVMHEFQSGELEQGTGGKVRNPKQAIAIALSEAGASYRQSPQTNRRRLADAKRKERAGQPAPTDGADGPSYKALYAEAAQKNIRGRSGMTKAALQKALKNAR